MRSKSHESKKQTFKIRKNDLVYVIAGKERGKTGKVNKVLQDKNRVIVEKLMMVKRHTKKDQKHQQGGIIEKEGSIHISNVMLLCGKCNKPTRVGSIHLEDGQKARICKKCQEVIL
ncbi:MAG: 50S ribosomal protein L24 [Thermoplasmata archaeon]|nr:MAG: 50S ribosomal protein L24 [Thermoplasmata archaeon]